MSSCRLSACPLIYMNGFTTPGEHTAIPHTKTSPDRVYHFENAIISRRSIVSFVWLLLFVPSRFQDVGLFQHHRPNICWHEWYLHGARFLQQLHCLQAAQRFFPEPTNQVRAEANQLLSRNRGSVTLVLLDLFLVHCNNTQPLVIIIMMFSHICSQKDVPIVFFFFFQVHFYCWSW